KWTVFLHPEQRKTVERSFNGPARVTGSAGTGKTIVALHRAVHLARTHPDARILLTTFSDTLANALRVKLRRLIGNEPRLAERLEVHAMPTIGRRLYELNIGPATIATANRIRELLEAQATLDGQAFSQSFLTAEWNDVVDAWQLQSWESYRDVLRLGRKTRLPESQRATLWAIFERVRKQLAQDGLLTYAELFSRLAAHYSSGNPFPYDFIVVDEAQDLSVSQLRFLAAAGRSRPDALFFAGDLGQRIFQQPFSWKALGEDIGGRSSTLRVNYRTSHQIRSRADQLLGPTFADVDGVIVDRRGTTSVFNGPDPAIEIVEDAEFETALVAEWLTERVADGVKPHEMGVFVRSPVQLDRAQAAVGEAGLMPI